MGKGNRLDNTNILHLHHQAPADMSPTSMYTPIFDNPPGVVTLVYGMFIWLYQISKNEDINKFLLWTNMARTLICMFCSCQRWRLEVIEDERPQPLQQHVPANTTGDGDEYAEPGVDSAAAACSRLPSTSDSASVIVGGRKYNLRKRPPVTSNKSALILPSVNSSGLKRPCLVEQSSPLASTALPEPSPTLVNNWSHVKRIRLLLLPTRSMSPVESTAASVSAPVLKPRPRPRPRHPWWTCHCNIWQCNATY
jgi:hypothetical protein